MSTMVVLVSASTFSQTAVFFDRVIHNRSNSTAESFALLVSKALKSRGYKISASFPAVSGMNVKRLNGKIDPGKFYVFPEIASDEALRDAVVRSFERILSFQSNYATTSGEISLEEQDIHTIKTTAGADTLVFVTIRGMDSTGPDKFCNWTCCIVTAPIFLAGGTAPLDPAPDNWWAHFWFIDAENGQFLWHGVHNDKGDPKTPSQRAIAEALTFFPAKGRPMDPARCTRHGEMAHCKKVE